jgi:hypothetical protein
VTCFSRPHLRVAVCLIALAVARPVRVPWGVCKVPILIGTSEGERDFIGVLKRQLSTQARLWGSGWEQR